MHPCPPRDAACGLNGQRPVGNPAYREDLPGISYPDRQKLQLTPVQTTPTCIPVGWCFECDLTWQTDYSVKADCLLEKAERSRTGRHLAILQKDLINATSYKIVMSSSLQGFQLYARLANRSKGNKEKQCPRRSLSLTMIQPPCDWLD